MTLVITNCSKRKRLPVDETLLAGTLAPGSSPEVARAWTARLRTRAPVGPAESLYGGRGFSEARRAALLLGAPLAIVSAGLGLIDGETLAPSYSLTTAGRDPDNVLAKTTSGAAAWWSALQEATPFRSRAVETETGLILAALSASYVGMVAEDWSAWPPERLGRLRLFTKGRPQGPAAALAGAWMPYDDRLDAVGAELAGTQSDFAQRALRHFAEAIKGRGSADLDRAAVMEALGDHKAREVPIRERASDDRIEAAIRAHWAAVDGRSALMLRHLRDELGMACEQGRFRRLFHSARVSLQAGAGA